MVLEIAMQFRSTFGALIALLWLVATHHCALEDLSYRLFRAGATDSMLASDSVLDAAQRSQPLDSGCPAHRSSHGTSEPGSHEEGVVCGSNLLYESARLDETRFAERVTFSPSVAMVPVVDDVAVRNVGRLLWEFEDERSSPILMLRNSLDLTPNAPPFTLL